jgi:NADPH2:quinone reductase
MQAVLYRAFGPAREVLKLEGIPAPEPGPGEVQVRIAFSGVNPSDVKLRAGARAGGGAFPYPFIIPHSDGSGVITMLGDGVDPARLGQPVWVWNGQWRRAHGTCAEVICLPADQAVPLPEAVSLEVGATLGIPGLTACHTVFSGGEVAGKTVLVQGGAGSVGFLAVQLARWGGARVIATARGQGAMERVAAAGADAVLDFTRADLGAAILEANGGAPVDHIVEVEFGRNAAVSAQVIAENGRICAYGSAQDMTPALPFYPLMFKAVTLDLLLVYILSEAERAAAIANLTDLLERGALSMRIFRTLPLSDCAAAHELIESGARQGSVVLTV